MKKLSAWSVALILPLPVFATEDVSKLYGDEPAGVVASQCVVQESVIPATKNVETIKKTEKTEKNELPNETESIKKVKEIKEIEEIKTVKEVHKTEKQPEVKEKSVVEVSEHEKQSEPEQTYYNPETRFPHGLQFGAGVSPTTGLNGFVGYNNKKFDSFWAKRFGIRFDFAGYSPIRKKLNKRINDLIGDDGFDFDDSVKVDNLTLNAKHIGAMIDFYPFGDTWFLGGWRISGGYIAGKLDLDANIHGTSKDGEIEFELNDHKYYYAGDEMHAKIMADWKYKGPYVGTGFDWGLFWGFKMYFDAGIVFTGKAADFNIDVPIDGLKNENGVVITEGSDEYNQFTKDKEQTLKDVRDEVKDYPYYPIVKLGIMYRF